MGGLCDEEGQDEGSGIGGGLQIIHPAFRKFFSEDEGRGQFLGQAKIHDTTYPPPSYVDPPPLLLGTWPFDPSEIIVIFEGENPPPLYGHSPL